MGAACEQKLSRIKQRRVDGHVTKRVGGGMGLCPSCARRIIHVLWSASYPVTSLHRLCLLCNEVSEDICKVEPHRHTILVASFHGAKETGAHRRGP